jgi:EAL domain-containing protein (putative c-di-GMP-specific phosphodiesterase class I)
MSEIITEVESEQILPASEDEGENLLQLQPLPQSASTIEAALAIKEPVVYFYTVGINDEDRVVFIKSRQMLNDKLYGRIIPEQYVPIAELSNRIETLNLIELQEVKKVIQDNKRHPFVISLSCRLLLKDELTKQVLQIADGDTEHIIFSFDASTLDTMPDDARQRFKEIKAAGYKIMLEAVENAPIKILSELQADYIRLDFRFYKQRRVAQVKQIEALMAIAKAYQAKTVCAYIKHITEAKFVLKLGVNIVEGYAIGEPTRSIRDAVEERRRLKAKKAE